jgi:2-polyprenyl-3-methyl-5-hydroxy-6-metoxy-1,4-benzoquinol methylase
MASNYHFLFEDWEASTIRQAAAIASILERECPAAGTWVLDCACGIGTQALGLAKLGFCVTGADVSAGAIERARSEATARKLKIPFYIADMRNLGEVPAVGFDAVICMDNAPRPHLPSLCSMISLVGMTGTIRTL